MKRKQTTKTKCFKPFFFFKKLGLENLPVMPKKGKTETKQTDPSVFKNWANDGTAKKRPHNVAQADFLFIILSYG
jgi:hypothetical protein